MQQKTSLNKISNNGLQGLKERFSLMDLHLVENNYMVLLVKSNELNKLLENHAKAFDSLTSSVAMSMEEYLQDDFKRWNVYIMYLTNVNIEKNVKYKIENDTFFARKIVVDDYHKQLTDENIEKLILKYITINDLNIENEQSIAEEYESTSEVFLQLRDKETINSAQIDEILKLLENEENEI